MKMLLKLSGLTLSLAMLAACNGGGGGTVGGTVGGTTGSTYGAYQSPYITVSAFVSALNSLQGSGQNNSYVELYEDETYRSYEPGQEDWFVIWDDKFDEYKAFSLQYIRSVVYYDYYSNNQALAEEVRAIETDDILSGHVNGDPFGDDYEVVDYDFFTDSFWGRNSGFEYEDETSTTDVSLLAAEKQQEEFIVKALKVNHAFEVGLKTSMFLVDLSDKAEKLIAKNGGEMTASDLASLDKDIKKNIGVSLSDVTKIKNAQDKAVVMGKVAEKIGKTGPNFESKLAEIFNQ